jgi:hypothetical protein
LAFFVEAQGASNLWTRRNSGLQSCGKTSIGEFVSVAIAQIDPEPMIFNGIIQTTLKIGIPHVNEMIASK